jgi:hypothetical protein
MPGNRSVAGARHTSRVPGTAAPGSAGSSRSSPPSFSARPARLRSPLRLPPSGMPDPLSVTWTLSIPPGSTSTVTSTWLAPACLAALDSASRSAASICSAAAGLTSPPSPAPSRSDGAKPSMGVSSSTRPTISPRRSGPSALSLA